MVHKKLYNGDYDVEWQFAGDISNAVFMVIVV